MGARNKVAGLLGQRFLERKSKMVDEDSHSTDLRVAGEEGHSTILLAHYFFDINWGQSYFQIFTKMLRNLTLLYNLHILTSDQQKFFVFSSNFWATFVTKSNFWATFWEITANFLENRVQLVESPSFICEHLFKTVFSSYFSWPMLKIIVKNKK